MLFWYLHMYSAKASNESGEVMKETNFTSVYKIQLMLNKDAVAKYHLQP